MTYRPTIGLEIHAELATATKMFCACKNDPDEARPNVHVCPVCMAHPGAIPAANAEAIRQVLRVGMAIGGTLAPWSEFDRKNYFYPDIPKGYQISQYEHPLVLGGSLAGVAITRVHLEEDTARSSHEGGTSLVDFNRAGVPLMELVTEPVIHDAETAGMFARELQLLLRTLGAGHANLEKGEMRIEANISVSKTDTFGTKVEVKNLNSFRAVERAIAYEIARQSALLDEGGQVMQETRGWNEDNGTTFHQRRKEGSADYRYFPEPDLPKIVRTEVPAFTDESLRASLPELPHERRERYQSLGLEESQARYLGASTRRATFFDGVIQALTNDSALIRLAANYLISDAAGWYAKQNVAEEQEYETLTPDTFAALVRMTASNKLSSRGAKDTLAVLLTEGGEPESIAAKHGFTQVSDPEAIRTALAEVLTEHAAIADEFRAGKEASLQFLIGQSMRHMKGAGNPAVIKETLLEMLKA